MESKNNNIQWLDTLRTLAMLVVIIIHVSTPLVKMTYGRNMPYWWIGNVVDSAVRFAVPLFLMLSGATLLGKEYNLVEYYRRRFSRVLVPFLFWIVVYWVYRWWVMLPKLQPHDFNDILQWGINLFLNEGVSKHFWYIYMILFLYLFVPFLGKVLRKISMPAISNLLLLWAVFAFVCRSMPLNMYSWSGNYASKLLCYALFSGYIVLGYYLSRLPVSGFKARLSFAFIFMISIGVSAIATYLFSQKTHNLDLSIYSYLSINSLIQSIAIFMWIKDLSIRNKYISGINSTISNYSYGIYLSHILVIGILFNNGIYWSIAHPLLSLPLLTMMVLVCSFAIIYVLRKIPVGKYIAG
jgi:surface polysaccharide O-acyltransferase-like enzyme